MFKWFMIISVSVLAIAWAAYWFWNYRQDQLDKKHGKAKTKHLKDVDKSFSDYINKVEKFEKKTYKKDELQ